MFIYPFLEAVATFLADSVDWSKAGFRRGEAPLQSMAKQLKALELYKEESHSYLADGIIKLYGLKGLEILLLETSGCFASTDRAKHSFDHHKGLFGALSMLKFIADKFHKAAMDTFCKSENIYLWSLRYEPKGPVFELWLETTLHIKPEIDDKLESLPAFLNFFWVMKCLLAESLETIDQLKQEHNSFLCNNLFNQTTTSSHNLSSIVNPLILKLTEEENKAGFHKLGPFYSDPSSP